MQDESAVESNLVSGGDSPDGSGTITKTLTVTPTVDTTYKCKVTPPLGGDPITKTAVLNVFGMLQRVLVCK